MTRPRSITALLIWCLPAAAVVLDRIAVVVDKHVIKTSDIDRDVRVAEFLNRAPLDTSVNTKRQAAERLIDQTVIREEMDKGGYSKSSAGEVDGLVKRMLNERFGGSAASFRQELVRYGLTEAQLRLQLQWQLDVLKFLDQRFRPGVMVTDEQVKSYYGQHRADLERQFPQLKTYAALEPKIRESLEGGQLNKNFEDWLAEARKRDRILYRQEAFQ
jgi:peptidyl-prolyl cis-trans isomerase SurA